MLHSELSLHNINIYHFTYTRIHKHQLSCIVLLFQWLQNNYPLVLNLTLNFHHQRVDYSFVQTLVMALPAFHGLLPLLDFPILSGCHNVSIAVNFLSPCHPVPSPHQHTHNFHIQSCIHPSCLWVTLSFFFQVILSDSTGFSSLLITCP